MPVLTDQLGPAPLAFSSLPLPAPLLSNLDSLGYRQMTPIQAAALPLALQGRDLIAQARTGSGKTAAFGLALLSRVHLRWFGAQALVLCPTRELADQVTTELRRLGRAMAQLKVVSLCGGVPLRGQVATLEHGVHVVVGTPGRVLDHLERGSLELRGLRTLVLDEADRMLDMGFADALASVLQYAPAQRQTLLFSATYPSGIDTIAQRYLRQPQRVQTEPEGAAPQVEQRFFEIEHAQRLSAALRLLQATQPQRCLAFCNTRQQCTEFAELLVAHGWAAMALHGDMEQAERELALACFSNGSCSVLVTTDVAARGIDIADLPAVLNVSLSPDPQVHVHRIGRTGRAGAQGLAMSLATARERAGVQRLTAPMGQDAAWYPLPSEIDAMPAPVPALMRTVQIQAGRKDRIRPADVLGALTGTDGGPPLTREQVGKIQVGEYDTLVAITPDAAQAACDKLNAGRLKARPTRARLL